MNYPINGESLSDKIEQNDKGNHVYVFDCYNILICQSYGEIGLGCKAGGEAHTRCSLGEKMQIRILNDSNPNTTYKLRKPM
ncbi:hypothetical protein Desaci_0585 [Desulfosporosinus acidiphilus SJ4]|uniref:Uncharacterized protein n=1 Tax=Desulfosporosinus acidiphilus (strain DSM 22704 / JCM 16185 / SJ4) TaxID=646529 RepID=I4D1H3_DESAJ|nr:hypothetical protein [Desulfosporosinus acidiphilus]AFM39647.1 hypothetical protein Desaci_0585 [Desulfosporosinus acidiphilus SJ4]